MAEDSSASGANMADQMMDPMRKAGEAWKASGERAAQSSSAMSLKVLDQAETNAREAFAAMRNAAQASDFSQVLQIQSDFLREQGNRSMAQAREIGELILQFGRESATMMRSGGTGQGGGTGSGGGGAS
jgi:hypothetical protein